MNGVPTLSTDNARVNQAFRIAIGDIYSNISSIRRGMLEKDTPCLLAGLFERYNHCFVRDISVNIWNGTSLFLPDIGASSLRSVLAPHDDLVIPEQSNGQYWDSVVWIIGAWHHYLHTDDKDFLRYSLDISSGFMTFLENRSYDGGSGLFFGPAFFQDGPAAYPDEYVKGCSGPDWMISEKMRSMRTLSTNSLYYLAYMALARMSQLVDNVEGSSYKAKADALRTEINKCFWSEALGRYTYIESDIKRSDLQESIGQALAILSGIADQKQIDRILETCASTPRGIPVLWPVFERYTGPDKDNPEYGRTSGTIWPQVNGFWALAARMNGRNDIFDKEFRCLTESACTHEQFLEVLHPITGARYGGMQEAMGSLRDRGDERTILLWDSRPRQTWAATAYFRMLVFGVAGLRIDEHRLSFAPYLPNGIRHLSLKGLRCGDRALNIALSGQGDQIRRCTINGHPTTEIARTESGVFNIELELEPGSPTLGRL